MFQDIIKELFYEIHFDLGVSYHLILDYVNNMSLWVLTVIGVHLGVRLFRECILNP